MSKTWIFVYPGQGSQSVGMGFGFAEKFPDFRTALTARLTEADHVLGFKLSEFIKSGPAEKLKLTEITQPALLTVSVAMADWLASKGIKPVASLGHSLGEYSALVSAGCLKFSDAARLVHWRGKFMSEAVAAGVGGMAALIGAELEVAKRVCDQVSQPNSRIEVSVLNGPGQVVVSGHASAFDRLEAALANFPSVRKAMRLEVSGPFHCSLLQSAGEKLKKLILELKLSPPQEPIFFNVTASKEIDPSKIAEHLVHQVSETVLWEDSVKNVHAEFPHAEIIEVGSGKVLTGLVKKILPNVKCTPLESLQTFEDLKA